MDRVVQIGRWGIDGNRPIRFNIDPVLVPIPPKTFSQALVASDVLLNQGHESCRSRRGAQSQNKWGDNRCRCGCWRRRGPMLRPIRGANQGWKTQRSPRRATATVTTDVDNFETKLAKERTFERVVLLLASAEHAIETTFQGATPMGSHKPRVISCQLLERVPELLTLLISSDRGRCGRSKGRTRGAQLLLSPNHYVLIHEASISHDGVDSGKGEVLVLRGKLGKEI